MNTIYKIGVVIGIIAIYSLVAWGLGAVITHDYPDEAACAVGAWLAGVVLFLILAIFVMEKFGLWMV